MRIIAGKHKGHRLAKPKSDAVRPTTDRVRESLFAVIGDLSDAVVVDAYAGTGALGCESISRGAAHVFFFDASRRSIDVVTENLERIGESDRATVTQGAFTKSLHAIDRDVDVIFLDPPYGSDEPQLALAALAANDHVRENCLVVVEQDIRDDLPTHDAFEFDESRQYGDTRISFFYRN